MLGVLFFHNGLENNREYSSIVLVVGGVQNWPFDVIRPRSEQCEDVRGTGIHVVRWLWNAHKLEDGIQSPRRSLLIWHCHSG